jgi:hypothetical protein
MTQRLFSALLVFSAFLVAACPAHADKDAVQFGSNIVVPEGHSVHDAVFFGDVHITHQSKHDVVVFFGSVRTEDDAAIGHDVVNFFGNVHLGENVTVGNDLVVMFGGLHAADSANVTGTRFAQPIWVFWTPLLVMSLIIVLVVREIRERHRRQYFAAYGYPPMPPQPPVQPEPPAQ